MVRQGEPVIGADRSLRARYTHPGGLALVMLAGVTIAIMGAALPAKTAARLPIAEALQTE